MIMVRVMGCCSCSISIHLIVAIEECCRSVVLVLLLSLFFSLPVLIIYHKNFSPMLVIYIFLFSL